MSTSISNKSNFAEYRDVKGLISSNYAFNVVSGEVLDMWYFMC